jgi:hypothetical protein
LLEIGFDLVRLYLEQQRRIQEENEKRRIQMEREALDQRGMVANIHAQFPRIPEHTIHQVLQQYGFNYGVISFLM